MSMQGGAALWELTDAPEREGSPRTEFSAWNFSLRGTCSCTLRSMYKDIPGNGICDREHQLTHTRTL